MPQQQANIATVLAMLTEQKQAMADQGRKLDTIKQDFDDYRAEMPKYYAPRLETDKAFTDVNGRVNDHEARLRIIEGRIPNVEFSAFKDTSQAREKAQSDTNTVRHIFDERTVVLLQSVLLMLVGALLYFVLNRIPLH